MCFANRKALYKCELKKGGHKEKRKTKEQKETMKCRGDQQGIIWANSRSPKEALEGIRDQQKRSGKNSG